MRNRILRGESNCRGAAVGLGSGEFKTSALGRTAGAGKTTKTPAAYDIMVNGRVDELAEISQYAVLQDQRLNATPLRQGERRPLECRIADDERRRLRRVEPALEHARNKQPVGQMSVEEIPEKRAADKQIAQCFLAARYCDIREMAFNETTCRSQFRCSGCNSLWAKSWRET